MELVDMHGTPEAPVLSLHCIHHSYSLPGQRKMIQQKLKFLISMLQGLVFISRAVERLRGTFIVSMQHPWPLAALLRTLHQGNHSSALSDALLSSQPITPALGNVSLVTGGIWNFQQVCAIRCDTAPLFSADGSVLCLQGRRDLSRAVTALLAERAFKSVPNSCTFTPKPVYYNYYPLLAAVGKKNAFLQAGYKKFVGLFCYL